MGADAPRPILVTGAHRSGTTWLATMLTAAPGTRLVIEPFNLDAWSYRLNGLAHYWFTYAPGLSQPAAESAMQRVLDGKTGRVFGRRNPARYLPFARRGRFIIKDPIASFSSEWIWQRFNVEVLIVIRHPAAFAASLKRLEWRFPFGHLLAQEQLMDEQLFSFRSEIEAQPRDIIEQAALLWKVIYHVLARYAEAHREWICKRHEDLSCAPATEFAALYERLGLEHTPAVRERVAEYSAKSNPVAPRANVVHTLKRDSAANADRWRGVLSVNEIARIRRVTEPVAHRYYADADW